MHMSGIDLMAADEHRVFTALGELRNEITNLRKEFAELREKSTAEHRTVHDIVVASSEAIRNVARDVSDMKPHVESYKLKAEKISEAVDIADDYKLEQAEKRGADKFKAWLYWFWASIGGLVAVVIGKLWDAFNARPHPVLIALLLVLSTQALARDDGRYANSPLKQWFNGLSSGKGNCCSLADGYRVDDVDYDRDDLGYRVRLDGTWVRVPDDAVVTEPNRVGYPMVWPMLVNGETSVRCFLPGALN